MTALVRRLHILLGLLSFSHFLVYGVAGITAAVQTSRERPKLARPARFVAFQPDSGLTDKQVADAVYKRLGLPFTRPMPEWFLKRTTEGDLRLDFYNINGIYRVTVLEGRGWLQIEEIRNNVWLFLEDMHAMTGEEGEHFRLLRLWGLYNIFAMWTLIAMSLSGMWLGVVGWR